MWPPIGNLMRFLQVIRKPFPLLPAIMVVLSLPTAIRGSEPPEKTTVWSTGVKFQQKLEVEVPILWQNIPLRHGLRNLSENHRLSIFLDRRIDPGQTVDCSLKKQSLDNCLRNIAGRVHATVCYIGPIVYVGPKDNVRKLATLIAVKKDIVRRLPIELRRKMLNTRTWKWETLTSPRDLIHQLAIEAEINIHDTERIPHDLWPAADVPALSFIERFLLVTAGFDLSFELTPDQKAVRLVPMPDHVSLVREYRVGDQANKIARQFQRRFPHADIHSEANKLVVQGQWDDHQEIRRVLQGKPRRKPPSSSIEQTRFTLSVKQKLAAQVLTQLAETLDLELIVADQFKEILAQRISFYVDMVTRDELLRAVLEPVGLSFRINDGKLEIVEGI